MEKKQFLIQTLDHTHEVGCESAEEVTNLLQAAVSANVNIMSLIIRDDKDNNVAVADFGIYFDPDDEYDRDFWDWFSETR